jgi:hypothetical protein
MNEVTVITPPDALYNDTPSILLICPSTLTKNAVNSVLFNIVDPVNLYLYETPIDGLHNIEWLIKICKLSSITIIDVDNCDPIVKVFSSHVIAQGNTFYLTNDNATPYNLISKNRIYDFVWLENLLIDRGKNE